jgi:Fe-S-cluster containining protein
MSSEERCTLQVHHPLIREVDPDIFRYSFVADCMGHGCAVEVEHGKRLDDACCRFGCDVSPSEQAAILARAPEIAAVLDASVRDPERWFDRSDPEPEPCELEPGTVVRTHRIEPEREDGRCVFLHHANRGCALHAAALANDFAPESIKPAVCRLYPIGFGDGQLGLADDFDWYSCAHHEGPSVYRVCREAIEQVFGPEAVAKLDDIEARVLKRHLRVTA